ncbi:multicopper oxidase family protein [Clostridium polynesiense]|uniref:multicopper oxidase family protein n=1 Tax=Clostridium polynesiense TaxID=1325933 RepID=UPI000AD48534|nr:multicopper oxidase [Clostridium polynesiense]
MRFSKDEVKEVENMELYNHDIDKVDPSKPDSIPKFVDELLIPSKAVPVGRYNGNLYYEIYMKRSRHYFHRFFPSTMIWGYNGTYPGPTFEVLRDQTIWVKWINNLPMEHFLPVDRTVHGAIDTPEARTVVHLHGANVDPDSDGGPDSWYTSNYVLTGKKFSNKVYKYTNNQQATTLWYHDHSLGSTRLNVYAGLAGFYFIRDFLEEKLNLPKGEYEIPLMIQDKSFNEDGSLFYPDSPPFPVPVKPSIVPAFIGNTIVVNGKIWPYLKVEPRKYRFRILNASNTRAYTISLSNGNSFIQIGTDGGLLSEPVEIRSATLEPAERIDVVIDFSKNKGEKIQLMNVDNNPNTRFIMEFKVTLPLKSKDTSEVSEMLYPMSHIDESLVSTVRNLTLSASIDHYGRPMLLLNNRMWDDPPTETPKKDSIEIWNLINLTAFPHPIHVHLVQFKIMHRRPFNVEKYLQEGIIEYTGEAKEPEKYERGWKDTVKADPGMVTSIIMQFKDHSGDFVWHCHILEHEDHDMMRPLKVLE